LVPLPGDNCAQRGHLARSVNVSIAGVALQQKLMQPEILSGADD
jgi:hypothetical protein